MSQERLIKMACAECKTIGYHTRKPKIIKEKLQLRKFCRRCRGHQVHKEAK